MALVIVGGADDSRVEVALGVFESEGWSRASEVAIRDGADSVLATRDPDVLRAADARGIRYVLVHHGPDDGVPEGTYARAHHRVESRQLPELARRLRSRDCPLVTCLAFSYRHGIPEGSAWVIDARFLDNPYWVPELRDLDGRDPSVRDHVLGQAAAGAVLDGLVATVLPLVPAYAERGRMELTIAFGCTGGRHRSVVLAAELARRLSSIDGIEVACRFPELDE